jgi:hypothetical protein
MVSDIGQLGGTRSRSGASYGNRPKHSTAQPKFDASINASEVRRETGSGRWSLSPAEMGASVVLVGFDHVVVLVTKPNNAFLARPLIRCLLAAMVPKSGRGCWDSFRYVRLGTRSAYFLPTSGAEVGCANEKRTNYICTALQRSRTAWP